MPLKLNSILNAIKTSLSEGVAWHGTPYRFDKFSLDNIGSGEGNQAFGHGLYFAGNPEVAKYYRDEIYDSKSVAELNTKMRLVSKKLEKFGGLYNNNPRTKEDPEFIRWANMYNDLMSQREGVVDQKLLYKVEIPDHDQFMVWFSPLNKQSEYVKNCLNKMVTEYPDIYADYDFNTITGGEFYKDLGEGVFGPKEISHHLRTYGIKGNTYMDMLSRGKDYGTYNYVVFDDRDVKILDVINDA